MCVCWFLSCNFGEHGTNVTRFYALYIALCRFLFLFGTCFFGRFYKIIIKKDPMNSDVWGSLYTSVTSPLYLSRNFRLGTIAGIRTMTSHGFLVHLVLLGSFGIAMMLIALQFLRLIQVSTLWWDLFLVEDDPLHEDLDLSMFWSRKYRMDFHFRGNISVFHSLEVTNICDSNGSPLQHYQTRNSFWHLFSIKSSAECL